MWWTKFDVECLMSHLNIPLNQLCLPYFWACFFAPFFASCVVLCRTTQHNSTCCAEKFIYFLFCMLYFLLPISNPTPSPKRVRYQNPEFGHTQGEIIKKKPSKKYISIQRGMKLRIPSILVGKLSFILSSLFPERLHYCYIYFQCS